MYVINSNFLYFIVHCYNIFQNKFEIKIFKNGRDIILDARLCKKKRTSQYQMQLVQGLS